jgi:uracil-DNA glycosylase
VPILLVLADLAAKLLVLFFCGFSPYHSTRQGTPLQGPSSAMQNHWQKLENICKTHETSQKIT